MWVWVSGGLTTLGLVALLIACLVTLVGAKVIGEWPTSTQMVARATSTIDINLLAKNTSVPSIPTHTLVPPLTLIPTPRPAGTSVSLTATPTATTKPTPKPTPTMRLTAPPTVIRWEKDGKEMVLVPAGEFLMGSLAGEGEDDEHPQHRVYLDAFYMDKTEVTNAEYKRFVDATGYRAPDLWTWGNANGQIPVGLENHPVWVSWEDAAAYARWAGKRLPTEAEWEKTARGTDGRTYPWGNDWDPAKANTFEVAVGQGKTTPVGNYPAGVSPYGVLDMAGNLWEWCADWYSEDYYGRSPASNPTGPVSGIDRVLRGGSCLFPHLYARCAYRSRDNPALRKGDYGFRCCLSSTSLP